MQVLVSATCLFSLLPASGGVESPSAGKRLPDQARSTVISRFGIVATSQTLASQAGTLILERGGNAVDAAIAANAVLGLAQAGANGIGGDLFVLYYDARAKKLWGLNASGWSPAGMTIEFVQQKGLKQLQGIHSVTVPGAVAGWDALERRFGKLGMAKILAPAIFYAENGFPAGELSSAGAASLEKSQKLNPEFRRVYVPGGRAPRAGEMFRNPDLAGSLRRIAEKGRDGFYKGATADAIVRLSKELGGAMTAEDLERFEPEWVEPISTTYRGWTVYEMPPNGHGLAALSMLNIMEQFPLAEYGHNSVRALHVMIEAKKLAYADMIRYVGDPRFSKVPAQALISKPLAIERAKLIDPDHAHCQVLPSDLETLAHSMGKDTIYMSAIDKDGNIVSLIQSNSGGFGSFLVPEKCGFVLHNRGSGFSLEPGKPNSLAGHKRPLHTIIPGFMEKGDIHIGFGIQEGWNQAQAQAQFVANIVDFGLTLQAAIEAPRFSKYSFPGCDVRFESRFAEAVLAELTKLGHTPKLLPAFSGSMGRGQAVMRDGKGVNYGASDPRGDGAAVPEGPPVLVEPGTSRPNQSR